MLPGFFFKGNVLLTGSFHLKTGFGPEFGTELKRVTYELYVDRDHITRHQDGSPSYVIANPIQNLNS